MSGGGAQQGQAGGMQQPLGGGMGQAAQGGFGSSALTFGNIAPPVGATNPQDVSNNRQQFQSSLMGSPMQGGMQQQLPPQMQGGMAGLLQGGGFGMGQNLQGGMQQPLAAVQGGMPIRAPNGNFGVPGGMGGGLPAQGGGPMGLTQQQIDKIRQQMQNEPGDTFIPQGNSQGQSFGNMLSGLSPEFRAGLLGDGMRAQVQLPAGGPAAAEFYANYLQNQGGMPMQAVQTGMPRPPVGAVPPNYLDYLQGLQNSGQSLMGDINAGQPGIPSTQGGIGSLGPMRSTPTPARPLPPTPTRPQPANAVRTINRAEQQAKIQGAQDQINRLRSMGVGGARDYISQLMGRR